MFNHSNSLLSSLRNRLLLPICAGLLAACGGGGGGGDSSGGSGDGGGAPDGGPVTISGKAVYEFAPPAAACRGLDFHAVQQRPIRQATIQLLDAATDTVLDAGVTTDTGDFALSVDSGTEVYIRVRAELKRTGGPSWDVEVRDNTRSTTAPLKQRPLYVLDTDPFDSGNVDVTRDVTAATGWNDSTASYTGTRAAAPFAVLDTAYAGMLLVLAEDPQVTFEPLDIFWSSENRPSDGRIEDGDISTSFYSSENNLFLLGAAGSDADEFDDHVVAHEWGHYFEDVFSRSDSIGGAHSLGDELDMRVAFGEGFATALSGMVLGDALYCDTTLSSGFSINIEDEGGGTPGWFNEVSVMELLYDLWDTAADGVDSGSIGFGPVYRVMTGAQAVTSAFTSIFSFAAVLKEENPLDAGFINELLAAQNIRADGMSEFGDGETNDGSGGILSTTDVDVLPVYTRIVPDGSATNVCSNSQYDRDSGDELVADGNKLSEHRFLRMTIDTPARYSFQIRTTNLGELPPDDPQNDHDQSDPDIRILLNGESQNAVVNGELQGFSGAANEEVFTTSNELVAGEYAMALVEFRYQDEQTPADYPARTCFDVIVSPAP
ncbi:MAG TPA: hypothetical protein VHG33_05335 [Woeseiaceae bacterium]|nr:hypothetical protein [Woeseiaceae bacterium]